MGELTGDIQKQPAIVEPKQEEQQRLDSSLSSLNLVKAEPAQKMPKAKLGQREIKREEKNRQVAERIREFTFIPKCDEIRGTVVP